MHKLLAVVLLPVMTMFASDLPTKKYLDLAAIKTMVAASEAKAKELNVSVTICVVDESGNLLFSKRARQLRSTQFSLPRRRRGMRPSTAAHRRTRRTPSRKATSRRWLFRNSSPTREVCQSKWMARFSAASLPAARSRRSTSRSRRLVSTPCSRSRAAISYARLGLKGPNNPFALADGEYLVDLHLLERLQLLRSRPLHFDQIDRRGAANAEVEAQIALRHHAGAAVHLVHLRMLAGRYAHPRSNRSTIALRPHQLQLDPVLFIAAVVAKQRRRIVHVQNQNIDIAVVVVVAECRAPA